MLRSLIITGLIAANAAAAYADRAQYQIWQISPTEHCRIINATANKGIIESMKARTGMFKRLYKSRSWTDRSLAEREAEKLSDCKTVGT